MTAPAVVHLHPSLGYGGTQKSVATFVREFDGDRFDHTVVLLDSLGVRGEALAADDYDVVVVDGVEGARPYVESSDVVHVHGGFQPGTELLAVARRADVPAVLKSSHFGKPDDGDLAETVDRYLYVSKMILLRYLLLAGRSLDAAAWSTEHRLLYNPYAMERDAPTGATDYRAAFDIPADAPVLGKIGRSAPEKWGKITVSALDRIVDAVPEVHLLVANTPAKIKREIRARGLDDHVHDVDGIPLGEVGDFHDAVDVLTHASAIGESCGYVMLEAMANRTPVVVNAQPMRDNAQVEVVDHGTTGYVANSAPAYAEAVVELLRDDRRRDRMGDAGRKHVRETFDAAALTRRLESLYATVLVENGAVDASALDWWDGPPSVTDMRAFAAEYDRRLRTYYDGAGYGYDLERRTWTAVGSLPLGRAPTYELARKGFLFVNEYL